MNRMFRTVMMVAALGAGVGQLAAAPMSFVVTTNKKRFEVDRSSNTSTKSSKEQWGYSITIENKTFKALENLDVEYRQFKFDDDQKKEGALKPVPGSTKIPVMANGAKFKFDTVPVTIEKQELKANWSYTDGSKEKVKDALAGYWLRILKDGEVVFETQYPLSLKDKVKWE